MKRVFAIIVTLMITLAFSGFSYAEEKKAAEPEKKAAVAEEKKAAEPEKKEAAPAPAPEKKAKAKKKKKK